MKRSDYRDRTYGVIEDDHLGPWTHGFYMPAKMPTSVELSQQTYDAVTEAQFALGKLAGLALLMPDPELLLAPAMMQEALSSSRIEGTQASLSDVLSAEIVGEARGGNDVREVLNYLAALKQGATLLGSLPITSRFFCALHETLMKDVRGDEKYPGELRKSPVWVGSPGGLPENAKYIPPLALKIPELISDWENFVNLPPKMPAVVRCALMHYQFETIHPFLDGNGRIGRLLIGLMLMQEGILPQPIFYISSYIENHRNEYYERLQAVREQGHMDEWIQFFSRAVVEQALESANRIDRLVKIQAGYRAQVLGDRSAIGGVIDLLLTRPMLTVELAQNELGVSQPTASNLLRKAEGLGWIRSMGRTGRGGKQRWYAPEIWAAGSAESPPF
jgi:Fic family protein